MGLGGQGEVKERIRDRSALQSFDRMKDMSSLTTNGPGPRLSWTRSLGRLEIEAQDRDRH